MLKKLIALICVFAVALSLSACQKDNTAQNDSQADSGTPIKSLDDLIGVWRMEVPWPENEAKEFGEDLGVKNFSTTAKMTIYIKFNADGTATYLNDLDLLMDAAKKSYYTIFTEAFAKAKKVLDEKTFTQKVEETLGYQSYKMFLEKQIPNQYKDSPSHIEFFRMGNEEMLKYKNKPIEEQAAIGALWAEILEEVGYNIVFVDGKWQSDNESIISWTYDNGALLLGETSYGLEGNVNKFILNSSEGDKITCTRIEDNT